MTDERTPTAVIHGLREGNREAWARLYDRYGLDLWRYVARLLGQDEAAVGDIVQDSFLEAARSARQFDPNRGSPWVWLVGIAHHRVSAHWRQANRFARFRELVETGVIDIRGLFDGEADAKSALESHEAAAMVRYTLAELAPEYASLLTAKYLDDRSLAEVASEFGSSIEATKSKLARARKEFRAKFEFLVKVAERPKSAAIPEPEAATE